MTRGNQQAETDSPKSNGTSGSSRRLQRLCSAGLVLSVVLSLVGTLATPAPLTARPATLRWAYYVTYDRTSWTSLQAHVGQLDVVAPYFYQLQADGTITDNSDPTVVRFLKQNHVEIVPMIKNVPQWDDFHAFLSNTALRQRVIQQLVTLIQQNQYDGINIDFEAVNAADAPLLTQFMTELSAALHPLGKLVTQAVIPRTSDAPTRWGGAYDYAALARSVDYLIVMVYDHHSQGSATPGPIAPLDWITQVMAYLTQRVPRSQLLLGLSLYGYDWDTVAGPPAKALRFDQVQVLMQQPGVQTGFDPQAQEPWITYVDSQQHLHQVWYANAASIAARFRFMLDQTLAGFAFWRLGQEDPAVWNEVAQLNTPATRIPPFPSTADRLYFPETGHSLAYGFKAFWQRSGGLPVFGYPLTEEFDEFNPDTGQRYTVQYFERQRFEYHPEFKGTPYEVELGRLGVTDAQRRGLLSTPPFQPLPPTTQSDASCQFFPETGHRLCNAFRQYWQSHGLDLGDPGISFRESLALFGYPISEEFTDPACGCTVQYFERARFEYHPENPDPYKVLLGLLGTDTLRAKGWIR
ncbi:glycosyl hydrolase family 18 protein [Thermorudis peleae]|uniref:glycosyl hydrolase family 18 protein n=1 Tax=Thermorudis peleae TaxID=1382356 RepID=UPI00068E3030|nr:glycosyl hydrolase family 18 protein [Thermorudis peleae]